MKRNNEDIGINKIFESNNSDDENNEVNDEKWPDTKRRRETSPNITKHRISPLNEENDLREKHGK